MSTMLSTLLSTLLSTMSTMSTMLSFWVILGHFGSFWVFLVEFWLQKHHLHCIVKFKKKCSEFGFSLQGIAVKIKRSLQGSPVENTHKMLRIWMGKKRSGRTDGRTDGR